MVETVGALATAGVPVMLVLVSVAVEDVPAEPSGAVEVVAAAVVLGPAATTQQVEVESLFIESTAESAPVTTMPVATMGWVLELISFVRF